MCNTAHPIATPRCSSSHSFEIRLRAQSLVASRDLPNWVELTTGRRVDRSSTWRWCNYGLKAPCGCHVRLPSVRLGKTRFTTEEAIAWWTAAIAQVAVATQPCAGPANAPEAGVVT